MGGKKTKRDWSLEVRMVRGGVWTTVSYDIVAGIWYKRSKYLMWSSSGLNYRDEMIRCRTPT